MASTAYNLILRCPLERQPSLTFSELPFDPLLMSLFCFMQINRTVAKLIILIIYLGIISVYEQVILIFFLYFISFSRYLVIVLNDLLVLLFSLFYVICDFNNEAFAGICMVIVLNDVLVLLFSLFYIICDFDRLYSKENLSFLWMKLQ